MLSGDGAVVLPGTAVDTLEVIVRQGGTVPVAASPVTWTVRAGDGSIAPLGASTDAAGRARAVWTLGASLGPQELLVSAAGTQRRITATAAPPFIATAVAAGGYHTCATDANARAYCWGTNHFSQLGNGLGEPTGSGRTPGPVAGSAQYAALTAGQSHTCGITLAGGVDCWGSNQYGQLGDGTRVSRDTPVQVRSLPTAQAIAAGSHHTCALTSSRQVFCWGDNGMGQAGAPAAYVLSTLPTRVSTRPLHQFVAVSAGEGFSCAVDTVGVAYCWGSNRVRELGADVTTVCQPARTAPPSPGTTLAYPYPPSPCIDVPSAVPVNAALRSLSSGTYGSCGVDGNQGLWCWGYVLPGPMQVPGARVRAAWIVGDNVCGLTDSNAIRCWNLLESARFTPVQPFGDDALHDLTGRGGHSCGRAAPSPAVVYCWGDNSAGQLGDGTRRSRVAPAPVVSPMGNP